MLSKIGILPSLVITVLFVLFAVWISNEAEKILQAKDPGSVVIDEIAGMILTLIGLPFNIVTIVAGFLLFRMLDIWKPYPIRFFEKQLSGGMGVVMDDVAAGILSNLVLRVLLFVIKTT